MEKNCIICAFFSINGKDFTKIPIYHLAFSTQIPIILIINIYDSSKHYSFHNLRFFIYIYTNKKPPHAHFLNTQGLSCHILSSAIFAHKVLDNLFFFLLFRCNFCCFCMFFAIANDHKCHAEYY